MNRRGLSEERRRNRGRLSLLILVALLVAACGDSGDTTTTTAAPEATTATTQPPATTEPPATTQATTTTTVEEPDTAAGTPLAVAEEFIAAGITGGGGATLPLLTPELREDHQDFQNALGVWNDRFEQIEPCEELASGRIRCVALHHTDFHEAGGLSPFKQTMTFTVNEAGLISDTDFSVAEWSTKINPFNTGFMSWIVEAHPEEAARMSGAPMGGVFYPEDAEIALQYVDEFVAQSDDYPINS